MFPLVTVQSVLGRQPAKWHVPGIRGGQILAAERYKYSKPMASSHENSMGDAIAL